MKTQKITDIGKFKAGDTVLRNNGLLAPASTVFIKSVDIIGDTYATVSWKWSENSGHYYVTDFRMSTGIADYGFWHDLTTQNYAELAR